MDTERDERNGNRVPNVDEATVRKHIQKIVTDAFVTFFVAAIFMVASFSIGYNFALLLD